MVKVNFATIEWFRRFSYTDEFLAIFEDFDAAELGYPSVTSSSAVAKKPIDALCLSVVGFNSTKVEHGLLLLGRPRWKKSSNKLRRLLYQR